GGRRTVVLVQKPSLLRDKLDGGGTRGPAVALVQKPSLHRDKLGGGGTRGPAVACAEALAPPRQARRGRDAIRVSISPRSRRRHWCRDGTAGRRSADRDARGRTCRRCSRRRRSAAPGR